MEIKDNQITTGNITGNNNATNVTIKKKIKIIQFALKQKDSEAI